jgi:hypothetical protein
MVLKKQGWNIMQTKELIGLGVAMGKPQAYGVVHYLDDFLLDDYSFSVKKLHHKTISHLFLEWLILQGIKIIRSLKGEPQIKFGTLYTENVLSFQHSLHIKILKKNHLETQTNARNNKRQNLSIKKGSLANFFYPLKYVTNFCCIFCAGRG